MSADKLFIKKLCRFIYCLGMGACWYKPEEKGFKVNLLYKLYWAVENVCLIGIITSEFFANFRKDLTVKEKNDAMQFVFAHITVYAKYLTFYYSIGKIKIFFRNLLEDCRIPLTSTVDIPSIKKCKIFISSLAISMFCCGFFVTVDGIRYHFKEGIPARTLVTYWPAKYDEGFGVEVARVFVQAVWWFILASLVALDGLCLSALILLGFRFKTLQIYFKDLKRNIINNSKGKSRRELEAEMEKGFLEGVKLHVEILKCARNLQHALGNIYSWQLVQSIGLLAICLLKLVTLERNLTFLMANLAFISCLVVLTACYMMACGDVTYEASLVPDAMFNCGWEMCAGRRLRPFMVIAIQCSTRPVVMTAFGVYNLSYQSFISVIKTSYSFFAVMY